MTQGMWSNRQHIGEKRRRAVAVVPVVGLQSTSGAAMLRQLPAPGNPHTSCPPADSMNGLTWRVHAVKVSKAFQLGSFARRPV